jgi:hypothetical protein
MPTFTAVPVLHIDDKQNASGSLKICTDHGNASYSVSVSDKAVRDGDVMNGLRLGMVSLREAALAGPELDGAAACGLAWRQMAALSMPALLAVPPPPCLPYPCLIRAFSSAAHSALPCSPFEPLPCCLVALSSRPYRILGMAVGLAPAVPRAAHLPCL